MSSIMLGVFDGYLPLSQDHLTSMTKAGGIPTYFRPNNSAAAAVDGIQDSAPSSSSSVLSADQTTCRACGERLFLLVQAFCPLSTAKGPHHRMMYVFCCNSAECASKPSDSWRAFSYQIDVEDLEAYDANDSEEDEPIPVEATPAQFLNATHSFPPIALDIIDEPKKEVVVPTDVEAEMIRAVEERQKYGEADQEDLAELEANLDLKSKTTDYSFDHFRRRIARCGSQVLRYQHGGVPIFMNVEKVRDVKVPPCVHCGGPRCMELQVVPTVLYYVQSKNYVPSNKKSGDDGVDFATATVYVCQKSCLGSRKGEVVQEEFLFVEPPPSVGDDEQTEANGSQKPSLRQYFQQLQTAGGEPTAAEDGEAEGDAGGDDDVKEGKA